jgi:PAS domain S-box-containing protein
MADADRARAAVAEDQEWRWKAPLLYLAAFAGTAAAYGLTLAFPRVFSRVPFGPYMVIGGILTLLGGRGPGYLMAALSFATTTWLTDPPIGLGTSVGGAIIALPTVWFIDRHRRAVRALRHSERRYAHLCELSSDIVLTADLDGRIVSVSEPAAQLLGYSTAAAVGRDSAEFVVPADRERVREARRQLLARPPGETATLEIRAASADGRLLTFDVRSGLAVSAGKVVGFHTLARDVTERRRLEQQLRHAQKMEAIGRLAGGIAHDFNNLLTAIRGFADLALDNVGPDHAAAADLRDVQRCCDQAAQIVGQLLAFGRRQESHPEVIDVNEAVAGVEPILRRLLGSHIAFDASYGQDVGRITVDPHHLTQVVMNLAINARDAMPDGGRLTLATRLEEVCQRRIREGVSIEPGRYAVLSVADTGTGIGETHRPHIFEPFYTTKPEGEGTGLGLATVYGIVKQSGGYIWLESELGQGTRFDVCFPQV